jgi:hypothetical protein
MEIEWDGGVVLRCVGLLRWGMEDSSGHPRVGCRARPPGNKDWRSWKDQVCRTARHNEIARVETRKDFVMLIAVSCGHGHWDRWRTESHLGGSESLDSRHGPTALGAKPEITCTG